MKSTCQERLEARQAQRNDVETSPSEKLQAMGERISRAREKRKQHVTFRRLSARDRVLKAQAVARAAFEDVESRSHGYMERLQARMEEAEKRRLDKLSQTSWQCQKRNERVSSTLQGLADRTIEKRRMYDASVRAARHRRAALKSAYVSKLAQRAIEVESKKERIIQSRRFDAATMLQRWFRQGRHVRQVHSALRALCSSTQAIVDVWTSIGRSSVDTSMMLLQNRQTAAKAHVVGKVLFPGISFRIILMAGMLVHHPRDVMDQGYDSVLHFAAKRLCRSLTDLTLAWSSSLRVFTASWRRWESCRTFYTSTFDAWKRRDGQRLTADMLKMYEELFTVLHQATVDGSETAINKTKEQLKRLRGALVQALGSAAATEQLDALERTLTENLKSPEPDPVPPRSPPVSKKPNLEFTKSIFANDSLAHELILNPHFQLPTRHPSLVANDQTESLERRVQATMHQAFWDHVEVTQDPAWMVGLLAELRDAMRQVCKAPRGFLNDSYLESMADSATEWPKWVALQLQIVQIVATNEAPARNETTMAWRGRLEASLASPPASKTAGYKQLAAFLRFGFDKVEEIRLDSLNAHLTLLAPYLQRHGVDHEAKKFAQRVEAGSVSLDQTTAWIKHQVAALGTSDVRAVLRAGAVALVETYIESPDKLWPETFALDVDRVRTWRNRVDAMALQASCVALAREVCGQHGVTFSGAPALCAKLAILLDESTGQGVKMDDVVVQVVHEVTSHVGAWSAGSRETFERRLADVGRPSNAVFRLFFQRIMGVVRAHVMAVKAPQEVDVPPTLALIAKDVSAVCVEMAKLIKHNEAVHAAYYNRLVRDAADNPRLSEVGSG